MCAKERERDGEMCVMREKPACEGSRRRVRVPDFACQTGRERRGEREGGREQRRCRRCSRESERRREGRREPVDSILPNSAHSRNLLIGNLQDDATDEKRVR